LVSCRGLAEYRAMFDLGDGDVAGVVADCGAGAASAVAELAALGGRAVAVDPAYGAGRRSVVAAAESGLTDGTGIIDRHADRFVWDWYGTPARRDALRREALRRFTADIDRRPYAYVAGGLPYLPLADRSVDLVLCSHLLFTWADRLDREWHRAALAELVRVCRREVRVFPLVLQGSGAAVPFLGELCDELRGRGARVTAREVPYEFQRGAHAMLVISGG
jgi:SAM-dependent methyltransferase